MLVGRYTFEAPTSNDQSKQIVWEGSASVEVYQTAKSNEGMYLHAIHTTIGTEYIVAPREYKL